MRKPRTGDYVSYYHMMSPDTSQVIMRDGVRGVITHIHCGLDASDKVELFVPLHKLNIFKVTSPVAYFVPRLLFFIAVFAVSAYLLYDVVAK